MSATEPSPPSSGAAPPGSTFVGLVGELLHSGLLAAPPRPNALAGLDRFEIQRVLGAGGMGVVLLARDPDAAALAAIKLLRPEHADQPRTVHRFLVEARHQQKLDHPHILKVLEVSEREQGAYFAMPYLEKGSLARRIKPGQALDPEFTLRVALQIADALRYAHAAGLIHRDLKPANVLLDGQGNAFLADFGLARALLFDSIMDPSRGHCEGTAPYMSPAVAAGLAEDTRCDIYSFGAMLYEMLTGHLPYEASTPEEYRRQILAGPPEPVRERNPTAPTGLAAICEGALARKHRDRYADMADVVADLERVRDGRPILGSGHVRARSRVVDFLAARGLGIAAGTTILLLATASVLAIFHTQSLPTKLSPLAMPTQEQNNARRTILARSGPEGRILFLGRRTAAEKADVWTVNPDGGELVRLTDGVTEHLASARWRVAHGQPTELVFVSDRDSVSEVWRIRGDGTLEQLTRGGNDAGAAVVSPDGKQIAWVRQTQWRREIHLINSDGSNDRRHASFEYRDWIALRTWRPDGLGLLVALRPNRTDDDAISIYSVSVADTNRVLYLDPAVVVGKRAVHEVAFSRDGGRIVWAAQNGNDSPTLEVYLATLKNGTVSTNSIVPLTNNRQLEDGPVFSPDALRVAFRRSLATNGYSPPRRIIVRDIGRGGGEHEIASEMYDVELMDWAAWGH
jgi:serine/threonine protein kinase/Tol biopolymer transport system component